MDREDWIRRAESVLKAPEIDTFLARFLVSELRTVPMTSSEIRATAELAQSAIKAALRYPDHRGQA